MKKFNTTGVCVPELHYMVDITERLKKIRQMIEEGKYFTINRARQYGKTTTLTALEKYLSEDYTVVSLDFQGIDSSSFSGVTDFCRALARLFVDANEFRGVKIPKEFLEEFRGMSCSASGNISMDEVFRITMRWCREAEKPVVLLVDEVDSASGNQVFLDFLAQLRFLYISRAKYPNFKTFQSVVLAGVTDIRNLKRKLRPEEAGKFNSPWNIAADFDVEMSFSAEDIEGMLREYENDHHTGMDIREIAGMIFEYTEGYPFLVSRMCEYLDVKLSGTQRFPGKREAWTKEGVSEAARCVESESNTLFESMIGKLYDYPELESMIRRILFLGEDLPCNVLESAVGQGIMYGFVRNKNGKLVISNRIFETIFYDVFLTQKEMRNSEIWDASGREKQQFVHEGRLNMERILERYAEIYHDIYGDRDSAFTEAEGRKYFLLFLKPIINGTGNYYIEAETRNRERTDVIVDYLGKQYVIELKIWRGRAYNERGEQQILDYLKYYHLTKGYMLSYNFNRNKKTGVRHIRLGDKELVEAVV